MALELPQALDDQVALVLGIVLTGHRAIGLDPKAWRQAQRVGNLVLDLLLVGRRGLGLASLGRKRAPCRHLCQGLGRRQARQGQAVDARPPGAGGRAVNVQGQAQADVTAQGLAQAAPAGQQHQAAVGHAAVNGAAQQPEGRRWINARRRCRPCDGQPAEDLALGLPDRQLPQHVGMQQLLRRLHGRQRIAQRLEVLRGDGLVMAISQPRGVGLAARHCRQRHLEGMAGMAHHAHPLGARERVDHPLDVEGLGWRATARRAPAFSVNLTAHGHLVLTNPVRGCGGERSG